MTAPSSSVSTDDFPLGRAELIALLAMLAATIAFSIDAMLPAMNVMAEALTPDNLNAIGLVITSFMLGMGVGTFFMGPLSDAFGRKSVMLSGAAIYLTGAVAGWAAGSLEVLLVARFIQGLGASGPRVVSMAVVRDLFSGREMARILSLMMIVFTLVPAIAPTLGAGIIWAFGWRGIFAAFVVFSLATTLWLVLRLPETLAVEARRPLRIAPLWAALKEVLAHPTVRLATLVQTFAIAMLFSVLSSTQLIFDRTYGQGDYFHLWFGLIAILSASASFLNARLVPRYGMRPLIKAILGVEIVVCFGLVALLLAGASTAVTFPAFVLFNVGVFFTAGMTIGNLNALAMEPMGHIAGLAASTVQAVATVGAVLVAIPITFFFDGTALPLAFGSGLCATIGLWLTTKIRRDSDAG